MRPSRAPQSAIVLASLPAPMSMDNQEMLVHDLERRISRLERVVSQLVAEARARGGRAQDPRLERPQDRKTVTEKVTFDWQGENDPKT